jgi:nitroreductase/ketosteroid isomerase-like protein
MKMKRSFLTAFFFITTMTIGLRVLGPGQNRPGMPLREVFDLYVQAVQHSDLATLFSTVTENEKFFFLTSTGGLIKTRTGYSQFHQDWFKERDWEMTVDNVEVHDEHDFGYVTAVFHYRHKAEDRKMSILDSWFTLVFHKEKGMWKVIADICTPIRRAYAGEDPKIAYTSEQEYLFGILKNRRTVRKFKTTPVPKDHILKILDSARFAPTAGNQQPWKFLVIQDRNTLDLIRDRALQWYLERYDASRKPSSEEMTSMREKIGGVLKDVLSAPVYVAVLVDSTSPYPGYNVYDGSLAAGSLMIAARALGYGTGFFTTFFPETKMKSLLEIPDQYNLICFTPIGVPEEWPEAPPKKSLEDIVVFEKFK